MGALDFLFQGSPPTSVTTYGETTANVPKWYSDYTQGLISRANSIAAEPYQPYSQARIAGLDPAQTAAYNQTLGLQGQYQPLMNQSQNAISNAGAGSSVGAAQPYINKALTYNPYDAASGTLGQAGSLIGQSYGEFFLSCQISKDEIFEFYIESVSKGINSTVHYHSGRVFIQDECPICFELFIPDRISRCGHYTCCDCMKQMLKYNLKRCPLCRYEYNYN